MARLVVVGGGLSGLSLLHYLKRFGQAYNKLSELSKITLLESNDYLGGSVKTKRYNDGVLHELGPRSVRLGNVKGDNTVLLAEQLGLASEMRFIEGKSEAALNRHIYYNKQLYDVPSSLKAIFQKLPSGRRIYNCLFQDWKQPAMKLGPTSDVSVYDFFRYRFGEDLTEFMLVPLCRGISAGDARQLSMRSMFGEFLDREQAYNSVIRGLLKPTLKPIERDPLFGPQQKASALLESIKKKQPIGWNLQSGLQSLASRLCDAVMHESDGKFEIFIQSQVQEVRLTRQNSWTIKVLSVDGDILELEADHLFAAVPSNVLSRILKLDELSLTERESSNEMLQILATIPHKPVACVCLEYNAEELATQPMPPQYRSFGFLTHPNSDCKILGVTFDSVTFGVHDAGQPIVRMTVMMGGAWFKQLFGNVDSVSESTLQQAAMVDLATVMNIRIKPRRCHTELWRTGIPNYELGHRDRVNRLRHLIKDKRVPLTLLGQSYDGISVNDVIYGARLNAHSFVNSLTGYNDGS